MRAPEGSEVSQHKQTVLSHLWWLPDLPLYCKAHWHEYLMQVLYHPHMVNLTLISYTNSLLSQTPVTFLCPTRWAPLKVWVHQHLSTGCYLCQEWGEVVVICDIRGYWTIPWPPPHLAELRPNGSKTQKRKMRTATKEKWGSWISPWPLTALTRLLQ